MKQPALKGGLLALLAAALFGASTALVQHWGQGLGPLTTATLLYAGAAIVGGLLRQPVDMEAAIKRSDLRRLAVVAVFGEALESVTLG